MNIKTHLPVYCPVCGKMAVSERAEWDPKEAVIGELKCEDHVEDFAEVDYYAKGKMILENPLKSSPKGEGF